MASYLVCSTPVRGHVSPLLTVSRTLVEGGHRVRFLTGSRFREEVEASGARWVPLPPEAEFDDRDVDAAFPGRVGLTGVAGARFDLGQIFLAAAPRQLEAVDALLAEEAADAVLTETMFFGALLLWSTWGSCRWPCTAGTPRPSPWESRRGTVPSGRCATSSWAG
jgi:UDP:flavonoid glycosyltransferase YjiC (YdhE family)